MQIKNWFNILIAASLLSACGGEEIPKEANRELLPNPEGAKKDSVIIPASSSGNLKGYYVGDFRAEKMDDKKSPMFNNRINISIDSVNGEKIWGHSVVAGNSRPFSGSIIKQDTTYSVDVVEPGDDKYDGKFSFTIYPAINYIVGSWVANDKKLAVTERKYWLDKKEFKYNPDQKLEASHSVVYNSYTENAEEAITEDAGKFNASNTVLKSKDVENMYKRDLEVMRNAIYARHGYSFKNRQMRYYFDGVPWYIPVSIDITKDLTELEKKNIALIKRYEEHANSYYDEYGR